MRTSILLRIIFGILRTGPTAAAADSRNATTTGESACSVFINTSHRRRIILRVHTYAFFTRYYYNCNVCWCGGWAEETGR